MKRLSGLFIRLLLFASLVLASVPTGATTTLCVLNGGEVVMPVAQCPMPCCSGMAATRALPRPSCCAPPRSKSQSSTSRRANLCYFAGLSCRCETRVLASAPPVSIVASAYGFAAFGQPAILPSKVSQGESLALAPLEPGIFAIDRGPPRKRPRSPRQSRAPPDRFF